MIGEVRWIAVAALAAASLGALAVWPAVVLLLLAAAVTGGLLFLTVRRNRVHTEPAMRPKLVPEVVLLPTVVALTAQSIVLAALLTIGLAVSCMRHQPVLAVSRWPVGLALLACSPVWLRGASLPVVALGLAVIVLAHRLARSSRRPEVLSSLVDGAGVYLVVNVVGWLVGLRSPSAPARIGGLESTSSLFGERVIFPFTESLAVPPAVAAAYVAAAGFLLLTSRQRMPFRLVCLAAAGFVLVAADGRVAIGAAVGVAMVAALLPRLLISAPVVAVAFLLLPLGYGKVHPVTDPVLDVVSSSVPGLIREGEASRVTALSGRERIWQPTVTRWQELPSARKLVGYGTNGHVASGASNEYGSILRQVSATPLTATPHSSALQQLLDAGVLGLSTWLALIALGLRRVRRDPLAAAFLLTLVVTGLTEVTIAPGAGQTTLWLLLVGTLAAAPVIGVTSGAGLRRESSGQRSRQFGSGKHLEPATDGRIDDFSPFSLKDVAG